jgi:MFS family permease
MQHANTTHTAPKRKALDALRYPQYRAYWLGSLAAVSSFQIQNVSVGWLVYQLTGSPLYLGYVGLATAAPAIVLNLFGGVVADMLDQRRLIIVTQTVSGSLIMLLALLSYLELIQVWHVLVTAFLAGGLSAFNEPARQAILPRLLDRSAFMSAVALNSSIWQGSRIVAPAVAGLIIAQFGTPAALFVGCAGFYILALVMSVMRLPVTQRSQGGTLSHDLKEGVSYVWQHSTFATLIGMTFLNSFFGMAYIQLMPVFATDILAVGPSGLGFLLSAGGGGALAGTIIISALGDIRRKGLMITLSALLFGSFIIAFGLSNWYWLSLILLFLAGLVNAFYTISVMTTLQILVPDRLRGRVMGIYALTWSIGPLSAMQAGALAIVIGAQGAVAIGGMVIVAYAAFKGLAGKSLRDLGLETERAPKSESP